MLIQTPRGTKDIFGESIIAWQNIEDIIRKTCANFGVTEIRTPIFEHTELFLRGVGEESDIAQKEMYTFLDKGNRSITLRPEMTAGVARAFVEHKIYAETLPIKFYYIGSNFRYEKPSSGRWRQFHQFGTELFGSFSAAADAEIISLAYDLLNQLQIDDCILNINSLGGVKCRAKYNEKLKTFLSEQKNDLCELCKTRYEKNPMRVLDCKNINCQKKLANAPTPLDFLDIECKTHFEELQNILTAMSIPFIIDKKIVRGLDYYTRTVFEFIDKETGLTICGGGRYDGLIEQCGGPLTGAVGFGLGIERLIMVLERQGKLESKPQSATIFIGSIGDAGWIYSLALTSALRRNGIAAEADIVKRGLKAQMKYADRIGVRFSMILGDSEIENKTAILKNMTTGEQQEISIANKEIFIKTIKSVAKP